MTSSNAGPPLQKEDVWSYPRPPALEPVPQRLRVIYHPNTADSQPITVADTTRALRVLETSHPPTYYFPPDDVKEEYLKLVPGKTSFCEWKGRAAYFDFYPPTSPPSDKPVARSRIWTYPSPTKGTKFAPLANYYSFYASTNNRDKNGGGGGGGGEWKCFVGEEQVVPQDGDFYGGWCTRNLQGRMKGGPGTMGW